MDRSQVQSFGLSFPTGFRGW